MCRSAGVWRGLDRRSRAAAPNRLRCDVRCGLFCWHQARSVIGKERGVPRPVYQPSNLSRAG